MTGRGNAKKKALPPSRTQLFLQNAREKKKPKTVHDKIIQSLFFLPLLSEFLNSKKKRTTAKKAFLLGFCWSLSLMYLTDKPKQKKGAKRAFIHLIAIIFWWRKCWTLTLYLLFFFFFFSSYSFFFLLFRSAQPTTSPLFFLFMPSASFPPLRPEDFFSVSSRLSLCDHSVSFSSYSDTGC